MCCGSLKKSLEPFTATKGKLNTHFGVISNNFINAVSVSRSVYIIMQKSWLQIYLQFIRNQTYRNFLFHVQYTIVSDTGDPQICFA